MDRTHGILVRDSSFWVVHRRRRYGPFDYEWSKDLAGIELTFAGRKFGEFCSQEEIFADLSEFHLPQSVVRAATIVMGCLVISILNGLQESQRRRLIIEQLISNGLERFASVRTG